MAPLRFSPALPRAPVLTLGDGLIVLSITTLLYAGVRFAFNAPTVVAGPDISLAPSALPWYALLSVGRMMIAYFLSLFFSLFYGYAAAHNVTARRVLMPLLDVLQSVPILSFLPVVLLGLSAFLPGGFAAEIAAIILIFTSQVWNMTFSFYQSTTTTPTELREAAATFRFSPWLRFKTVELPFASIGLIWNSIMSWSGGWFFLMAAESFKVGDRDFRLPGLGSYLQTAASAGNRSALLLGLGALVLIIIMLDQLVWKPLLSWAEKFKLEMVEGDAPNTSWFLDALSRSWLLEKFCARVWDPFLEWVDCRLKTPSDAPIAPLEKEPKEEHPSTAVIFLGIILLLAILYGGYRAAEMLLTLPASAWPQLGIGLLATFARVSVSLFITLLWTIPVGVAIGMNRRLATLLQPVVQVVAAIPATALFPVVLLALLRLPGGLNLAAIALMLMGTQWYLLFNVIAGAAAIPQDLRFTTDLLRLSNVDRWRILILPSLFPYIVTGAITAGGGAWNASIVAEYVEFGGKTHATVGIGAVIAEATASGDYALLLAGTLVLVITVVLINGAFWRRLYLIAEKRYRME